MNTSGFVGGTLVHTEEGLVPIEQLKIGDKVLSKAANGLGELIYKAVMNTEPPRLYRRVDCLSQAALSDSVRLS